MLTADHNIAALSSSSGPSGRMIVRVTGPNAINIAQNVFTTEKSSLDNMPGFSRIDGIVRTNAITIPAACYLFRGPKSYTRQDLVEIHLPGNPALCEYVLKTLFDSGAKPAQSGEFTMRAFLSGRIDLSQAEAVADIISAENETQLRAAQSNASGKLFSLCSEWTLAMTELLVLVEASIDLDEEGIETISPANLALALSELASVMDYQLRSASRPVNSATLGRVVLVGRPNAGKSSLINAIAGHSRHIVSDIPGTTRDTVETHITLPNGCEVFLIDSAGIFSFDIFDAPDGNQPGSTPKSHPDQLAMLRTQTEIQSADIVIVLSDITDGIESCCELVKSFKKLLGGKAEKTLIAAISKCDLKNKDAVSEISEKLSQTLGCETIACSANSADGTDDFLRLISEKLENSDIGGQNHLSLHSRQREAIENCVNILNNTASQLTGCESVCDIAELISCDLRETIEQLGEISGHNIGENVLGQIFARFCVGK